MLIQLRYLKSFGNFRDGRGRPLKFGKSSKKSKMQHTEFELAFVKQLVCYAQFTNQQIY